MLSELPRPIWLSGPKFDLTGKDGKFEPADKYKPDGEFIASGSSHNDFETHFSGIRDDEAGIFDVVFRYAIDRWRQLLLVAAEVEAK